MASSLQLALASAQVETKLALAQFNLDFAIIKREAPSEYRDVGTHISPKRRDAAESGTIHKTAQRLGTLFKSTLPKTPALVKAYGLRSSEISRLLGETSKLNQNRGVFRDYFGLDTTSLFAAATSSDTAIAVHLLACLFARMFEARNAVAIWEELIASHKAKVANDEDGISGIERAAIATLDIQHSQLQEWDNSARAWLLSVDKLPNFAKKQTQLKLIVDNIGHVQVGHQSSLYESVLTVWKTSLETMDQVIGGGSFAITNIALLTAISAWHLYPDIYVVGSPGKLIKQDDPLLSQAGRLTLGLQSIDKSDPGVFWSLPLAYLRYYGPPVLASGSLNMVPTRLTIEQFLHATLGCVFRCWNIAISDFRDCAHLITLIAQNCFDTPLFELSVLIDNCAPELLWFAPLAYAANSYHQSKNEHRLQIERLLRMGFRNCSLVTDKRDLRGSNRDFLFMRKFEAFSWIKNQDNWTKTARATLQNMPTAYSDGLIIRRVQHDDWSYSERLECLYPRFSTEKSKQLLLRWIVGGSGGSDTSHMVNDGEDILERHIDLADVSFSRMFNSLTWKRCPDDLINPVPNRSIEAATQTSSTSDWWPGQVNSGSSSDPTTEVRYDMLIGNPDSISLLAQRNANRVDQVLLDSHGPTLTDLVSLMESNACDPLSVRGSISSTQLDSKIGHPLVVLGYIAQLYAHLPGATIATGVFDNDAVSLAVFFESVKVELALLDKFTSHHRSERRKLDLEIIATLESGQRIRHLPHNVFAISAHDSIYMAEEIFDDPGNRHNSRCIRRLFGNIGEAGLVALIEPAKPQIRKTKAEEWNLVSHDPFDGRWENNFAGTSLHLRFTGWKMPVSTAVDNGTRFVSTNIMEAVVSVYDSDKWVGDLDLHYALRSQGRSDIVFVTCQCKDSDASTQATYPAGLVCIDTWPELLNAPFEPGVFRARGNSEARLAASIICRMKGHPTVLFGEKNCWQCAERLLYRFLLQHSSSKRENGIQTPLDTQDGVALKLSSIGQYRNTTPDTEVLEQLSDGENDEDEFDPEEKLPIYII